MSLLATSQITIITKLLINTPAFENSIPWSIIPSDKNLHSHHWSYRPGHLNKQNIYFIDFIINTNLLKYNLTCLFIVVLYTLPVVKLNSTSFLLKTVVQLKKKDELQKSSNNEKQDHDYLIKNSVFSLWIL